MINQSRLGRYITYAFGEIILVVIGILIALQINNYNQDKTLRNREIVYIRQLIADMQQTEADIEEVKNYFLSRAKASAAVSHAFWNKTIADTLTAMYASKPWSLTIYNPILGTARSLINSGNIELIESPELRNAIISHVERIDAHIWNIERYENSYYRSAHQLIQQEADLWSMIMYQDSGDIRSTSTNIQLGLSPVPQEIDVIPFNISMADFLSNRTVYHGFQNYLTAHRNIYFRYNRILDETKKLRELLQDELNR